MGDVQVIWTQHEMPVPAVQRVIPSAGVVARWVVAFTPSIIQTPPARDPAIRVMSVIPEVSDLGQRPAGLPRAGSHSQAHRLG